MKKFLMAIPALALVLTACGSTGYDDYEDDYSDEYVPVCIDERTDERLEDEACEQGDDDFLLTALLVYMLASDYPGVGHKAKYYHKTKPKGAVLTKPVKKGYDKPKTVKKPSTQKPKSSGSGFKPKSSGGGFSSGGGKRR